MKLKGIQDKILTGWWPYVVIIVVTYVLYLKTLSFSFVFGDDNVMILDRQTLLIHFKNIINIFSYAYTAPDGYFYRPLLEASLFIDSLWVGISPFFYHLTNVLLHCGVCCILFVFLNRLSFSKEKSLLYTLLFCVHPVNVHAVAWIPGRNDTLLALFILSSILFFIEYLRTRNGAYFLLHLLFFAFGLFTKETALAVTIVCLLYTFSMRKDVPAPSLRWTLYGWTGITILWFYLRLNASAGLKGIALDTILQNIWTIPPALVQYIGKIIFPVNLAVIPVLDDTTLIYGLCALLVIVLLIVRNKDIDTKKILFGSFWFLIFLLPGLLFPQGLYFEHRLYVPLMGFIFVADGMSGKLTRTKIAGAAVILITFGILSYIHADHFSSRIVFWKSAVQTAPHNSNIHFGMAATYLSYDKNLEAEKEARIAIDLDQNNIEAHSILASLLVEQGDYSAAQKEIMKVLRANPNSVQSYINLGRIRLAQGRVKEAEYFFKRSMMLRPENVHQYFYLLKYYVDHGMLEKAQRFILFISQRYCGDFLITQLYNCFPETIGAVLQPK